MQYSLRLPHNTIILWRHFTWSLINRVTASRRLIRLVWLGDARLLSPIIIPCGLAVCWRRVLIPLIISLLCTVRGLLAGVLRWSVAWRRTSGGPGGHWVRPQIHPAATAGSDASNSY